MDFLRIVRLRLLIAFVILLPGIFIFLAGPKEQPKPRVGASAFTRPASTEPILPDLLGKDLSAIKSVCGEPAQKAAGIVRGKSTLVVTWNLSENRLFRASFNPRTKQAYRLSLELAKHEVFEKRALLDYASVKLKDPHYVVTFSPDEKQSESAHAITIETIGTNDR